MQSIALVIHVLLAIGVIGLVLIQHGKGADAGAAFGSGASATVFGARGSASFLTRATTILVGLFFLTSIALFYLAAHRDRSVRSVTDTPSVVEDAAPDTPAAPAAPTAPAASATSGDLPGGVEADTLPAAGIPAPDGAPADGTPADGTPAGGGVPAPADDASAPAGAPVTDVAPSGPDDDLPSPAAPAQ